MPSAGILVIGNEILSGKVEDTNSPYLSRELRALGVDLQRILVIPDDVEIIARETRVMSEAYDYVFTSGGIGPTHDDLTMDGIASAFGVPIERSESIVNRLQRAIGNDLNQSQLKMALVPKGAQLLDVGDLWFPVVIFENVHILPGIPERDRRVAERPARRFPGADARLVPEDRRGGVPRAAHPGVARRRLPAERTRRAAAAAAGRIHPQDRVALDPALQDPLLRALAWDHSCVQGRSCITASSTTPGGPRLALRAGLTLSAVMQERP
jgi:molybdenum cofactor synthesis domain-containing protein